MPDGLDTAFGVAVFGASGFAQARQNLRPSTLSWPQ
jgi:hypothetical protein